MLDRINRSSINVNHIHEVNEEVCGISFTVKGNSGYIKF